MTLHHCSLFVRHLKTCSLVTLFTNAQQIPRGTKWWKSQARCLAKLNNIVEMASQALANSLNAEYNE
jgi:hypothetical protein